MMTIGIASGKGGTGKTTVAANLARVASQKVCYVDCDVEEPNGHIFLKPEISEAFHATVPVPRVDAQRCNFCGKCRDVCRFNAVAVLPRSVIIFEELCHGCGGCALACPTRAITEKPREIGVVEKGGSGGIDFLAGRLNVGEAMAPPLIRLVKQEIPRDRLVLIDASPGTSCPVITAIQDVDYCLLVTEPTPFGLNDLKLAVDMVRKIDKPFGVVINRDGIGNPDTGKYCEREEIPVLIKIPDDRRIAEVYSRGEMIVDLMPEIKSRFINLLQKLTRHQKSDSIQSRLESSCS